MRYVSLSDQVHYIIDFAELPERQFTRVQRLLAAKLADIGWITFAHVETRRLALDEGLSARLPTQASLISKVGLVLGGGRIAPMEIVSSHDDFVRQGRGVRDSSNGMTTTDQVGVESQPQNQAIDESGDIIFNNYNGTGHYILTNRSLRTRARVTVNSETDRLYVDARDGISAGQPVLIEFIPENGITHQGSVSIPADAQAVIAYAVLQDVFAASDPGKSNYFNTLFVEARKRYREKHTDDTLGDIVRAWRSTHSQKLRE